MNNFQKNYFLRTFFISILTMMFFASVAQGTKLKSEQIERLQMVKEIALQYPNKKGETFEHTAMSICLTETYAGRVKIGDLKKNSDVFSASLGIMQVRLQTARFIGKKLKIDEINDLSDVQLVNKLLGDDAFNAMVAIRYLVWLSDHTQDYFTTVSRYNGGNINHPYFNRVMKNIKKVKQITALAN